MKLINLIGFRSIGQHGERKMYGLYECPMCAGEFECLVANVKRGSTTKCCRCARQIEATNKANKSGNTFIMDSIKAHGDKYDYTKVLYTNRDTKVIITCPVHGDFTQTPHNHRRGHGCDACAREINDIAKRQAIDLDVPVLLYYVYFQELRLWKFGCTSKTIQERFIQDIFTIEILYHRLFTMSSTAYIVEASLLKITQTNTYKGPKVLRGGNTELRIAPLENIEGVVNTILEDLNIKEQYDLRVL